jgi:hypothetical protein
MPVSGEQRVAYPREPPTLCASGVGRPATKIGSQVRSGGKWRELVIPGLTAAVFVKPQGSTQGPGIVMCPAGRGSLPCVGGFNGWDTSLPLSYQGAGRYEGSVELTAGSSQAFKIAAAVWGSPHPEYNKWNVTSGVRLLCVRQAG